MVRICEWYSVVTGPVDIDCWNGIKFFQAIKSNEIIINESLASRFSLEWHPNSEMTIPNRNSMSGERYDTHDYGTLTRMGYNSVFNGPISFGYQDKNVPQSRLINEFTRGGQKNRFFPDQFLHLEIFSSN